MKIILINKFFYLRGGSERVFFQEREYLLKQGVRIGDFSMHHRENLPSDYSKYFLPYFGIGDSSWAEKRSRLQKIGDGIKFVSNSQARAKLKALIAAEKPDIAHLHNIYHQLTPSIIPVLKKAGIKTVLTLHDYKLICPVYSMLRHGQICNRCNGRKFWNAARFRCKDGSLSQSMLLVLEAYWHRFRASYAKVNTLVAPSKFLSNIMLIAGYNLRNIEIIPNGINTVKISPSYVDRDYALFCGRLTPQKGLQTLLSAYTKMIHSALGLKSMKIKIVGDGSLLGTLKAEFPDAEFTGYKTGDELKSIIRKSSFVVVPSEGYENCSMTVLEAMAMGKPVIASNIGGLPEQIENGKTGFLFEMGNVGELADKMRMLAADSRLRLEMGKAARKKVEKEYSFDVHGKKLMSLYARLLAGN